MFAGLLGDVAEDLSVSVATAGQLITLYAIVYAVGSPVLVTITSQVGRKRLLIVSLAVFTGANVAAVVLSSFGPLLASRVIATCGAAIFTPTTAVVAASLAPPERRGRALATVTGGLTIAFAFGIPLGTLVGDYFGWWAAFVLVGVLGAGFVVFTYIGPLMGELTGYGGRGISGMLLLFGLAAIAGNALGGYGADRWGYGRSLAVIFVVVTLSLLAFSLLMPVAGSLLAAVGAGVSLVTWSVAGWAITPFQQHRLLELAPRQGNIVLSLNASAIYLGQGVGAGLGALALGYGSLASLGWVAALYAAVGLVVLALGMRTGGSESKRPG